jgi:RimJ/RimL family protein N-acetyltransferase
MEPADADRQYLFDQDMELAVLDCRPPVPTRRERTADFVGQRHEDHRDVVRMAIEADQQYIGHCSLTGLRDLHGNLELGIVIGDREYWSKGYGREVVDLLLVYGSRRLVHAGSLTTHRTTRDHPLLCRVRIHRRRSRQPSVGVAMQISSSVDSRDEWMAAPSSSDGEGG